MRASSLMLYAKEINDDDYSSVGGFFYILIMPIAVLAGIFWEARRPCGKGLVVFRQWQSQGV